MLHLYFSFMVVESYDETLKHSMRFYNTGADAPFNFNLLSLSSSSMQGEVIRQKVGFWLKNMPKEKWPNWVVSEADGRKKEEREKPFSQKKEGRKEELHSERPVFARVRDLDRSQIVRMCE